jgi:hypothetical protein
VLPTVLQFGVDEPLLQQVVPQAVPLQAEQVPPAVQYMPGPHELVVELQTQVLVLQVGVLGVAVQSELVAQPTQVLPKHTPFGLLQQFEPHDTPVQVWQVPEVPPPLQLSLALGQQLVMPPCLHVTPLAQPQVPALRQSGAAVVVQQAVPQAVPEQLWQLPPEQYCVLVQQALPPHTVPLHEVHWPLELQ